MKKIVIFLALLSFCFFGSGYFFKALAEEENKLLLQKATELREEYLNLNDSTISLEKQIEEMLAIREISDEMKKNQELNAGIDQLRIAFIEDQNYFPIIKARLMAKNYSIMSEELLVQEVDYLEQTIIMQKVFRNSIADIKKTLENKMLDFIYKKEKKLKRLQ